MASAGTLSTGQIQDSAFLLELHRHHLVIRQYRSRSPTNRPAPLISLASQTKSGSHKDVADLLAWAQKEGGGIRPPDHELVHRVSRDWGQGSILGRDLSAADNGHDRPFGDFRGARPSAVDLAIIRRPA